MSESGEAPRIGFGSEGNRKPSCPGPGHWARSTARIVLALRAVKHGRRLYFRYRTRFH